MVKFSPSGEMLAIGSHDHKIDIYMVPSFKLKFTLKKHRSHITHLDWSEKSDFLQSNCGNQELLYWDMSTGTQMTGGRTALRDEKWATFSCILGWPVQGIWPEYGESDYLNMVDRSNNKTSGGY